MKEKVNKNLKLVQNNQPLRQNLKTLLLGLLIYLGLMTMFIGRLSAQDQITVRIGGDQPTEASLTSRVQNDIVFVQVRELADLLGARTYYNTLAKKIVLYLGNHKVKVTAFNPFVMVDEQVLQMPIGTDYDEDGIWVPLNYFVDLISDYCPTPITYSRDARALSIVREGVNIAGVMVSEKLNGTLIRIQTTRKFDLSSLAIRLSQGWLYVDIYGGKVDSTQLVATQPEGIITRVVPIQFEESAQLSFKLKQEINREDISLTSSDEDILVSLRTSKTMPENVIVDLAQERKKWLIDKIIIDPGHGGQDPGTIGYDNLKEKDVVLDVAKRTKKLLEQTLNVAVLLTRDDDSFVELRERSAFANRNAGKLYISIHANSSGSRNVSGVETFCLGTAKTDADREIAEKENSAIRYEKSWADYGDFTNENYILMAIAQNSFNKESQELAAFVQDCLVRDLKNKDRGVKQSPLIVLIGTAMPKILIEIGFISNPQEAKKIRSKNYRQQIAETICAGVKSFKKTSEKAVLGN